MGNTPIKPSELNDESHLDYKSAMEHNIQEAAADEESSAKLTPSTPTKARTPIKQHKFDQQWEANLQSLREYKSLHNSCSVPVKSSVYGSLGKWCENQRGNYNKGKLSQERIDKLRSVGFIFEANAPRTPEKAFPSYDKVWKNHIDELKQFIAKFGNANVPAKYSLNPSLGKWVENIRCRYNRGELSDEKIEELSDAGFVFEVPATPPGQKKYRSYAYEELWETRLQEWVDYNQKYQDAPGGRMNPELRKWCENQRGRYRKNKLSEERVDRLKTVGFSFEDTRRRKRDDNEVFI